MRSDFRAPVRPAMIGMFLLLALALGLSAAAQSHPAKTQSKDKKVYDGTTALTIHLIGEPSGKPVPNASVYLRFREKKALLFLLHRKKHVELDLKSDNNGNASFSELPQGKVLVQIVAPRWQTFGEYYTVKGRKQTIVIKLHKPKTRWY